MFVGSIGSKFIGFFLLPFYTSWLTVSDYGITDMINTYSSFIIAFVSCCITDSIFLFPKDQKREIQAKYYSTGWVFVIASILIMGLLMLLFSKIDFFKEEFLSKYLWEIFAFTSAIYIQTYVQQFVRSIDKIIIYSLSGLLLSIFTAIFSFFLIPNYQVDGFVIAIISANFVTALITFLISSSLKYVTFAFCWDYCKEMLRYSIPLVPNIVMWTLISYFNRPLLENYCGMFYVGLFAFANKFPSIMNLVYNIFQQSWIISAIEESKKDGFSRFYNNMFDVILTLQIVVFSALCIFSKYLVKLLSTEEYYISWIYIPILSLAVIFSNIASFVGVNFVILKQSKYYFYSTVWAGIVSVIFNYLLIPSLYVWGACIALLLSQIANAGTRIYFSKDYVKLDSYKKLIISLLYCSFMIIIAIIVNNGILRMCLFSFILFGYMIANLNRILNGYNLLLIKINKCRK